ncbi:unnamed protein product [Adineta ricciae]|uniref:LamG domain-containing protein n=1 Tax=Adineta ricciae TaxID=249248 RepID=A0A814G4A8_ADIRI|nr:unnamed protein product [Adineta ricciae]CAF1020969.1 unnamed protein product [Adineta ricciae]
MASVTSLCRWLFQEPPGSRRESEGQYAYALEEMNGPIARVEDGIIGPYSAELKEGQWFKIPRTSCPALNLHGLGTQLSIVAWVKRKQKSSKECETIAGMWNETNSARQYCLFLNLGIWSSANQVCGHLSSTGAPSPDYSYCMEATIGQSAVPWNEWQQVAVTFDGIWAKAYLNGKLDQRPGLSPYFWPCVIHDGGDQGADFTVGSVFRSGTMGNWFVGQLGGLAVYDHALTPTQIHELYVCRSV